MICMLTPIAIRIKMIPTKRFSALKTIETIIVTHNKEMVVILAFIGIPFPFL